MGVVVEVAGGLAEGVGGRGVEVGEDWELQFGGEGY